MRRHCLLLGTGALMALATSSRRAHAADDWLGPDKALHFSVSVGLSAAGYGGASLVFDRRWQRSVAGAGFSLTLGAGKELYDLSGHGDASWKDFTWDAVGTAVGIGAALLVDLAIRGGHDGSTSSTRAPLSISF